jgi:hypothetical protein
MGDVKGRNDYDERLARQLMLLRMYMTKWKDKMDGPMEVLIQAGTIQNGKTTNNQIYQG